MSHDPRANEPGPRDDGSHDRGSHGYESLEHESRDRGSHPHESHGPESHGRTSPHHHHIGYPAVEVTTGDTALLTIDMQYHGASRAFGLVADRIAAGEGQAVKEFIDRVEQVVVPAIQRLQAAFRDAGLEVLHVKTQSLTRDGRDRSLEARIHGTHIPPGSREGDILDEIAPMGDEIVITKTTTGVFNGTNIEYLLRNLGIAKLVVGGVITGSCVELAVRDAADRGFLVALVEDATASWTAEMQASSIAGIRDRYARIVSADDIVSQVRSPGSGQVRPARPSQLVAER